MQRRTLLAVAALAAIPLVASCTPEELAQWQALHASDPAAAADVVAASAEPPYGVWDDLADCESGGDWSIATGNGYYGGLQFSASTWRSVGGTGLPHQNSREVQIEMGRRLQARAGWSQWPACSRRLGYR